MYQMMYETPSNFSNMILKSDGEYLTELIFDDENKLIDNVKKDDQNLTVFKETIKWLDLYFSGKDPGFAPKYKINKATDFRIDVINIMIEIPFGKVICYNDIAKMIAQKKGLKRMSAQAVGSAVGWNPICLIVPCHRVVGSNGSLIGYGGGMNNKIALLENEGINVNRVKMKIENKSSFEVIK